jgi:hypothetical protein
VDYSGVEAKLVSLDPTTIQVRFSYRPSFPLNYVDVKFSIDMTAGTVNDYTIRAGPPYRIFDNRVLTSDGITTKQSSSRRIRIYDLHVWWTADCVRAAGFSHVPNSGWSWSCRYSPDGRAVSSPGHHACGFWHGLADLNLYELYNSKVWDRLGARLGYEDGAAGNLGSTNGGTIGESILSGAVDLVDVFIRIAEQPPGTVNVVKYIRPPVLGGNPNLAKTILRRVSRLRDHEHSRR